MRLKYAQQISSEDFFNEDQIDLMIFCKNHEARSTYFYNQIIAQKKINEIFCFTYKEIDSPIKDVNLFQINTHNDIITILNDFLLNNQHKVSHIVIDYSSMTKSWYYIILQYFLNKTIGISKLKLSFVYTPATFSTPKKPRPNTIISPLPGKIIIPNNKPNALIVCLGYEENKAEGIIDHLDPKINYLFYSKPTIDSKFESTLEENNRNILSKNKNTTITYPFNNLLYLEKELTSLYQFLKDDYNVIIAPLGSKPFTLVSMLLSVKFSDVDIWRVGSGDEINEYDQKPLINQEIILEVILE